MVAYSFRPRFADAVLSGAKLQTIRAERRRHVRPGEELQLYTGMRTRQCRLLGRATCAFVRPVRLVFGDDPRVEVENLTGRMPYAEPLELDTFARLDGFSDWADLAAFWAAEHSDLPAFSGVLIIWARLL